MTLLLAGAVAVLALVAIRRRDGPVLRRSSRRADNRVAELVEILNARIDELAEELAGCARAGRGASSAGPGVLSDLGGSIDLDEVLSRTLEAATDATGSDAALVWLASAAGPPDGRDARAARRRRPTGRRSPGRPTAAARGRSGSSYRYSPEEVELHGDLIRSGLAVPMPGDDGEGYLVVFSRGELDVDDEGVGELEQLAERAGPAIDNARRFREARELADFDALTGLHNRRYFHETLAREVARAHRYGRDLALVVFDLDDFKAINDRIGHLAGDAVLADAAKRVRDVVRSADIACRVGGDEFASHPPRGERRGRRPALPTPREDGLAPAARRRHRLLGRCGGARRRRRRGHVLPAGRHRALPREGGRQGPSRGSGRLALERQEGQVLREVEDVGDREVVATAHRVGQQRRLARRAPANDRVAPGELLERGRDRRARFGKRDGRERPGLVERPDRVVPVIVRTVVERPAGAAKSAAGANVASASPVRFPPSHHGAAPSARTVRTSSSGYDS